MGHATPKSQFVEFTVRVNSIKDYSNFVESVSDVFGPRKTEDGKRVWWTSVTYLDAKVTLRNTEKNKLLFDIVAMKWQRHIP